MVARRSRAISAPAVRRQGLGRLNLVGVDIDLRKVYAWHSERGAIVNGVSDVEDLLVGLVAGADKPMLLVEIAGPIDYSDNKAVAHNKRRWTIFNVATAAALDAAMPGRVLVSPSSDWTHGYPSEARHRLARADAKAYDLRECQAMIWSYQLAPTRWRQLPAFLAKL